MYCESCSRFIFCLIYFFFVTHLYTCTWMHRWILYCGTFLFLVSSRPLKAKKRMMELQLFCILNISTLGTGRCKSVNIMFIFNLLPLVYFNSVSVNVNMSSLFVLTGLQKRKWWCTVQPMFVCFPSPSPPCTHSVSLIKITMINRSGFVLSNVQSHERPQVSHV